MEKKNFEWVKPKIKGLQKKLTISIMSLFSKFEQDKETFISFKEEAAAYSTLNKSTLEHEKTKIVISTITFWLTCSLLYYLDYLLASEAIDNILRTSNEASFKVELSKNITSLVFLLAEVMIVRFHKQKQTLFENVGGVARPGGLTTSKILKIVLPIVLVTLVMLSKVLTSDVNAILTINYVSIVSVVTVALYTAFALKGGELMMDAEKFPVIVKSHLTKRRNAKMRKNGSSNNVGLDIGIQRLLDLQDEMKMKFPDENPAHFKLILPKKICNYIKENFDILDLKDYMIFAN